MKDRVRAAMGVILHVATLVTDEYTIIQREALRGEETYCGAADPERE